jgi:hypothetical protein
MSGGGGVMDKCEDALAIAILRFGAQVVVDVRWDGGNVAAHNTSAQARRLAAALIQAADAADAYAADGGAPCVH